MIEAKEKIVITERIIGEYQGDKEGPLVIFTAGMHGNEPSGIIALRQVFDELENLKPVFRGRMIGLIGNLTALKEGKRFVDRDLNRQWLPDKIKTIRERPLSLLESVEDRESKQLLDILEREMDENYENTVFIDLHATSAPGGGFCIIADTEPNRRLASKLFLPMVFGLEEKLYSTLLSHFYQKGVSGMSFEGGQIGSRQSVETHIAGIWILLVALECIHAREIPGYRFYIDNILTASERLPIAVRTTYRHDIPTGTTYKSKPGLHNFQQVLEGQEVGRDDRGPVLAPSDGLILMPLYQPQGEDGFFIVESVEH